MSEFEKWYEQIFKNYTPSKRMAMFGFVKIPWDHQQKKIDKLLKCVEFYAEPKSGQQATNLDVESIFTEGELFPKYVFGKRARQCLKDL
jgi:hypothetical protein